MLPPVYNILYLSEQRPDACPRGFYPSWEALQYLSVRLYILDNLVEPSGFVLEDEAFIPAKDSRNPDVIARLKNDAATAENRRYVDNLLLHGDEDLACGRHKTVWQGHGEYHSYTTEDSRSTAIPVRLVSCPSIDANPWDGGGGGGQQRYRPWLADSRPKYQMAASLYAVYLYEVSTAYLRDKCSKLLLEEQKESLEVIIETEFLIPSYKGYQERKPPFDINIWVL
jgi:hypothetical protein